jgi:ArsR family transcriptional regulator
MTTAKTELFEKDLQESALIFKALAHPARLAILQFLAKSKVCMTGDITNEIPLSRTTVIQHLKELKDVSLILGTIEGVKVNYCLNTDKLDKVKKQINGMFHSIEKCC